MPTPTEDGGLWSPGRRALTIGLVLTVTLVASEALAVSNIMPIVDRDLAGGNSELYGWVFSGFFLGNLIGIVVAGLLVDRGSLVRPFALGLSLFSIGLLVGGLAPSMEVLVAARVVQGLGSGAIPAVAYVSIARALPEPLRPKMFATMSTAWVLPGVFGPALAGFIADAFNWRLVFLGLLPLIAVAALMTLPAVAAVGPAVGSVDAETASANQARRRLPLALVLAAGAGMLVAGLTDAELFPGVPLIVAGALLAGFAFRMLTPPGTLRAARGLPTAILLRGVLTFAFFTADVYVPLALQGWRGTSATVAGLALTAATLTWTAGAWTQAHFISRYGARPFIRTGFAVVALGVLGFGAILSPAVPLPIGVFAWAVAGLGMGLAYAPLSLTVLREAPPESQGAATAGLQLSDVLGTALGAGAGGALIAFGHRAGAEAWVGLAWAFGIGVIAAVVGSILAGRLRAHLPASEPVPAGSAAASVSERFPGT